MTTEELTQVRDLIATVRENLQDQVDVDTHVGDGSVNYRISPYQSVQFDLDRLSDALGILDRADLVQVDPRDAGTVFPVFADRMD